MGRDLNVNLMSLIVESTVPNWSRFRNSLQSIISFEEKEKKKGKEGNTQIVTVELV